MSIESILLFVTAAVNSLLCIFVLFGKRSKTNIIYSLFVLFASLWSIGLALFINENHIGTAHFIANCYYVFAGGIPLFFLYFSYIFPEKNSQISKLVTFVLALPLLSLVYVLLLDKNFLIREVIINDGYKSVVIDMWNYFAYTVYFVGYTILSYVNLIKSYLSKKPSDEKTQLKFIILGTTIGFIFGMIFDLFLPMIGNYKYIYLGPLFSFSMVLAIGYSITKHHLFNIKVIATEILTFVFWITILVRTLISSTLRDQVINGIFLVISVVLGSLLIKNIIKEVEDKEKIEKLAEELLLANSQQETLIHFITHQIKGFLSKSRNIYSMMLEGDYGPISEQIKVVAQEGLTSETKGVEVVKEILDSANLKKGTMQYTIAPFDLKPMVEQMITDYMPIVTDKKLKLDTHIADGDYTIQGDSEQIKHIIKNLIDNAVHYTETGSIIIHLLQDTRNITFSVSDTGIGIDPEDMSRLFTAGGRGKNSLKVNVDSTGFGLFIAKQIVTDHKGRIWVESDGVGKGSTFTVELPKNTK
jgi:signal transduction histidine kinase